MVLDRTFGLFAVVQSLFVADFVAKVENLEVSKIDARAGRDEKAVLKTIVARKGKPLVGVSGRLSGPPRAFSKGACTARKKLDTPSPKAFATISAHLGQVPAFPCDVRYLG